MVPYLKSLDALVCYFFLKLLNMYQTGKIGVGFPRSLAIAKSLPVQRWCKPWYQLISSLCTCAEVVQALVSAGSLLNSLDSSLRSPLHLAAAVGRATTFIYSPVVF